MKKILVTAAFLAAAMAMAQVGINNSDPKATLDVTAKTTDGTKAEGIIAPRLTGDQIKSADAQYLAAQTGTIVYATSAVGIPTPKTVNITAPGYYYFDGTLWTKFGSGGVAGTEPWYDVATNTGATSNDQDIFQTGKVSVGGHRANGQTANYEKFYISDTITTDAATRRFIGTNQNRTATFSTRIIPTADLPATFTAVGTHSYVGLPSSFNGNGSGSYVIGESSRVDKTGTGTYQRLVGAKNEVTLSNGITTDATGTVGEVYINATGSTSQDVYGFRSNLVVGSTVTKQPNLTGYHSGFTSETVGKTGKFYGFVAGSSRDLPTHIQQVDDAYGFYVQESMENRITATNGKWAFYNDANIPSFFKGYVGIGTNTPGRPLEIVRESTGSNINSGIMLTEYNAGSGNTGTQINLRNARGTKASPQPLGNGDVVASYVFDYYSSTGFTNGDGSKIMSHYRGNGTNRRSDLQFFTTGTSGTALEKMTIDPDGNVGIGTTAPTNKLHVANPTAGAIRIVDGTQQAGRVLTSDANGVGTWQAPSIGNKTAVVRFVGNHTIASSSVAGASANKEIISGTVVSSDITGLSANNNGELNLPAGKYMVFVSHDVDAGEYCIFKAKINDATDVYTTYYGEWLNTSFIVDMPTAGFISFYSLGLLGSINPNPTYYVQDYTNIGIQNTVTVLKLN